MQFIIRILTWFIMILIFSVLCIWMPIIIWRNPQSFESFVKLVELLISWPIVVAFLVMIILTRFNGAIDHLLRNITSVSFPGGNIQTQAVEPSNADSASDTWKFSYLNMFYIPITKQVLLWLSENPPQTKQNFHLMWQSHIPDPTQRETILDVLIRYGMLQVQGTTLSVTEEGDYFLRYLGLKTSG